MNVQWADLPILTVGYAIGLAVWDGIKACYRRHAKRRPARRYQRDLRRHAQRVS